MSRNRSRARTMARKIPNYVILTLVAAVFVAPVFWMVSASLKSVNEILRYPPTLLPAVFRWDNYARIFELQPFAQQFLNSIVIMTLVCALTLVLAIPAGYALARVRPLAAGAIFLVLLSGIFIPPEAMIVPLFRVAVQLGWVNTHYPLVVFTAILTTAPVAMFIMRQAFLTLPTEFEEAATLDGSGRLRTMLQIYLPLVTPSIASAVVFSSWFSWNQFLEPLVYLRDASLLTVPVALTRFDDPQIGPLWNIQMAAATLSVIPVLLVFFLAQRHVVAGLTAGALK